MRSKSEYRLPDRKAEQNHPFDYRHIVSRVFFVLLNKLAKDRFFSFLTTSNFILFFEKQKINTLLWKPSLIQSWSSIINGNPVCSGNSLVKYTLNLSFKISCDRFNFLLNCSSSLGEFPLVRLLLVPGNTCTQTQTANHFTSSFSVTQFFTYLYW